MDKILISHDTIKVLEENIVKKISDIPYSNIFTDMSPTTKGIKGRINKWGFIKIKSFYMAKQNISKMKKDRESKNKPMSLWPINI